MQGKNRLKRTISVALVLLFLLTPIVSARSVEVISSYSSTVTLDSWGDFYCIPVHDDMKISYSVHVINGSGVSVFLLEGNYTNIVSALDASYLVAYSSEDPKMDFSATYDVLNDDEDHMTVFVYGEDNSTTYEVSVSARELSSFEKMSNIALGILFLVGIFVVPALVRHHIRKSRRERKAAELARQAQMQSAPQNAYMQPPPQNPEQPQQSNVEEGSEAYRLK